MIISDKTAATISPDDIYVLPDRMRKLRPEKVDELVESIGAQGQMQPIVVCPREGGGYWLIAGWHRLEAVKRLGWPSIRATIVEGIAAEQAELMEIDENLIRADLLPPEEAAHHVRRKQLYLKLYPETKRGGAPGKAGGGKKKREEAQSEPLRSYTKKAASEIGKSNASVKRAVARGEKIPNVGELVGTSLASGEELDALAGLPAPVQRDLITRAVAGERSPPGTSPRSSGARSGSASLPLRRLPQARRSAQSSTASSMSIARGNSCSGAKAAPTALPTTITHAWTSMRSRR
jgi:ParB family chromosome partitioning protein